VTTINVYLNFAGNCEEAFEHYKSVFGGEFSDINRFCEMPPQEGMPPVPEEMQQKIMHISLPISTETVLMGSDTGGAWAPPLTPGNNFSIMVNAGSTGEADRLFAGLSDGGAVTMPLAPTFWGAYFGVCSDKFGINWMVSADVREG
jgi:PhnB protein